MLLLVRHERLSFFVDSVETVPEGWRLRGEPGYHPKHWARPGDRFDRACREHGRMERPVDLVVVELTGAYAIVAGTGGDLLRPDDIVSGQRPVDDTGRAADRLRRPPDATGFLAQLLGLPALTAGTGAGLDWSPIESELGVTLPGDYKTFIDAYGAGVLDDHVHVCAPNAEHDSADLMYNNAYAQECLRPEFAGPEGPSGDWHLGDASRWSADRSDIPSWFQPGDNVILWGYTGHGDFLFWHVKPDIVPDEWPVVLKERGPCWERYGTGFSATLTGLLTGEIQSEYLSRLLGGPHTYGH
ncbi:SMI1/KNR4 family protein [Dactylosporangium sp. NPDC049742]|uniref:SMI1/KNR4 family protein n=1 Tax=Dactylosporangium sp. NPDC049742 TaxID=3154737 RepID=UPI00343063EE